MWSGCFWGASEEPERGSDYSNELDYSSARIAEQVLDSVYCSSIDDFDLREIDPVDCIVFLRRSGVSSRPLGYYLNVKECAQSWGGVISLSNVRFLPVLRDLIKSANWKYQEAGVLDRTHLRFFTKKSMQGMLERVGLKVEEIGEINWERFPFYIRVLNRLSGGRFDDLSYPQFAIVASVRINT